VIQQGITVKKQSPSILMVISLASPQGTYNANFLVNYCGINLRDKLLRIPGVAQVDLFGGTDYGMRIWLRPDKLAQLALTPSDVMNAIKEQNLQAPAGRIGMRPSPEDQEFTYTVSAPGRLVTEDEFANIIIRETATGGTVRIKDVGRVELGSQDYNSFGRLNARPRARWPSTCCPGQSAPGRRGDLRDHARGEGFLPLRHGLHDRLRHDPRGRGLDRVHRAHVRRGRHPGDDRGLDLPAEPAGHDHPADHGAGVADRDLHLLPAAGLLGQHLSMFGLVLAIGIVVDDAIVVVEAVMHHIEQGMAPKDATIQA